MIASSASGDVNLAPLLAVVVICALLGAMIGSSKNRGGAGFALGLLLGPLGVIIALVMSGDSSKLGQIAAKPAGEGWHPDPLGRFDSRWYDGTRWTQHVGRVEADGTRRQLEDIV